MDKFQKDKINDIMAFFLKGLSPQGGSFVVASIADVLSDGLSIDETVTLSSFLGAISQMLAYIAAQRELNKNSNQIGTAVEDTAF
jgi:hypothetical protein